MGLELSLTCPFCNQGELTETEGVFDLVARLLGEARLALEARARGLSLRDTAQTLVSGERWDGGAFGRVCPYCRRARLSVSSDRILALDCAALVLGGARRYWQAGSGRRLSPKETAQLILDGRISAIVVVEPATEPAQREPTREATVEILDVDFDD